ncbi:MAG: chemotaxis protein CheW [Chitinivibrionales bacterium]|nr:chemotaxis protein CheW [Chitinivibrionales bacterium]
MIRQFATFYLGEGLFGIDVLLVREINRNLEITDVDPSPDFVVGLMNLRGQIVSVADLGVRLGLERRIIGKATCCIVLKTDEELQRLRDEGLLSENTSKDIVGLVVDKIGDMITVDDRNIEPPPANMNGVDGKFLGGVVKLDAELMATLKVAEILAM